MNVLEELESFITEFNLKEDETFMIDSIRVKFSKQYKLEKLQSLGVWRKIPKNSNILHKLKKRLLNDEITSAYRLENHNIYYYNASTPPKYRRATMVIFGMAQYHQKAPPRKIIDSVLSVLKDVSNIDVCLDIRYKPNLNLLSRYFSLKQYITKNGILTDTWYINNTYIPMIEKIVIYNKAFKNSLGGILWRIEAKISIPNIKILALPLWEFKDIINLAKAQHD